jgi:dUTPase
MVMAEVVHCLVEEAQDLDETIRGAGAFSSTGH